MAKANGVSDRVQLRGFCKEEDLRAFLSQYKSGLNVSECEGVEVELFDPLKSPDLADYDIVMEFHDHESSGLTVSQIMLMRFDSSHNPEVVNLRHDKSKRHLDLSRLRQEVVERLLNVER